MYLRLFATTDPSSPASGVALEYLKSLLRIAPVRVVDPARTIFGTLEGPWARYSAMFHTPMRGDYVNIVCTDPARWTWVQTIQAPKKNKPDAELETIVDRAELYTAGVRNVLIVNEQPTELAQFDTAAKYDVMITDTVTRPWPCYVHFVRVDLPITDHAAVRAAVIGPAKPR